MESAVVVILGMLSVAAGAAVFLVDSMARATYALLVSFLSVAALLLLLGAAYLGVLTALMMTVEMAIMAVFMLMFMMNPAGLMPMVMRHNTRGSLVIAGATFVVLASGALLVPWPSRKGEPPTDVTRGLGNALMGPSMLTMIVLGVALLATMVAGLMLANARGRYDRFGDRLAQERPDDPVPGGLAR